MYGPLLQIKASEFTGTRCYVWFVRYGSRNLPHDGWCRSLSCTEKAGALVIVHSDRQERHFDWEIYGVYYESVRGLYVAFLWLHTRISTHAIKLAKRCGVRVRGGDDDRRRYSYNRCECTNIIYPNPYPKDKSRTYLKMNIHYNCLIYASLPNEFLKWRQKVAGGKGLPRFWHSKWF